MAKTAHELSKDLAGKSAALKAAIAAIEKQFGKGAIIQMSSEKPVEAISVISTGIPSLDSALGIGGIPRGRVTEVFGMDGVGKTTLCLQVMASAVKSGGSVAFIDAEHALDMTYAEHLGISRDKLLLSQPDCGEDAFSIIETLVNSHTMDVIVIDSVTALIPRAMVEGEFGDSSMALHARLMSQSLRKLTASIGKSSTAVIFTNQMRNKINLGWQPAYANTADTTGGNALRFYATLRISVHRMEIVKDGTQPIGNKVKVKIVKNKVAPPFRECILENLWGRGFVSTNTFLDDLLMSCIVIKRAGSYYYINDQGVEEKLGYGKETVNELFVTNVELQKVFAERLRSVHCPTSLSLGGKAITELSAEDQEK